MDTDDDENFRGIKLIKIGFNGGNNQPNGTFLALLQDEECQKYLRLLSPTFLMSLCMEKGALL
jgi:hypothetical protein